MNSPVQEVRDTVSSSQLATAYSVCRGIARSAAKNFYYGFLVLPAHKRDALSSVYAFMRRCDDISDDPGLTLQERRAKLAEWLEGLHRALDGQTTDDPVLLALSDAVRQFNIPAGLLDQLAHGTAMDLELAGRESAIIRYRTFDDLYLYCYGVASVVGLICIRIFGYKDPKAEDLAERCGVAFQLTNIIRDVKEDAVLGRVYLPQEDLARFGLSDSELTKRRAARKFRPVLELQAQRAREFYRAADELIPMIAEDSQPALWVLVTIYRSLLESIIRRNYKVFGRKIRLGRLQKIKILSKGLYRRFA